MLNNENLKPFFSPEYKNLPESRYISIFLIRTTESECIFRTEGSGEGCSKELVSDIEGNGVYRAIISKRKQVAVERREGRNILRKHGFLFSTEDEITENNVCALNRNNPCQKCIDCKVYGYAVGSGGAQKSRVVSDDAFSLLPFDIISDKKTFNALYENNTMRDPVTNNPSQSIGEDEYIVPHAHFLDIEVLKDVTEQEFVYVFGNILRSKRYGAITSRIGSITNNVIAIAGSDVELFSTLEWVNKTAYKLKETSHPQPLDVVREKSIETIKGTINDICGQKCIITSDELKPIIKAVENVYSSESTLAPLLKQITYAYPGNAGLVK